MINLDWLSVKVKIDFMILQIALRVIYGLAPKYLDELISVKSPSEYHFRSSDQILLLQPKFKSLKTISGRAHISGPYLIELTAE